MDFSSFEGKILKSVNANSESDSITFCFTDDSFITVNIEKSNNSCHCHPEWQYFLDVMTYNNES